MYTKKIILSLFIALGVIGIGFYGANQASANNDNENHGNGSMMRMFDFGEQFKKAHENGSSLEVHISDNGTVLVRGAKVTAVNGSMISASTAWNTSSISWQVGTNNDTKFVTRAGENTNLAGIAVGDYISFSGPIASSASGTFGVNASIVKDWNGVAQVPANIKTTVEGKVKSVAPSAAPSSFVLTVNNKDYTVRVAADTSVLNNLWLRTTLSNMHVGDTVRVYGMVNSDSTIDATVVRDVNIR